MLKKLSANTKITIIDKIILVKKKDLFILRIEKRGLLPMS
jgi:hypothetical protein